MCGRYCVTRGTPSWQAVLRGETTNRPVLLRVPSLVIQSIMNCQRQLITKLKICASFSSSWAFRTRAAKDKALRRRALSLEAATYSYYGLPESHCSPRSRSSVASSSRLVSKKRPCGFASARSPTATERPRSYPRRQPPTGGARLTEAGDKNLVGSGGILACVRKRPLARSSLFASWGPWSHWTLPLEFERHDALRRELSDQRSTMCDRSGGSPRAAGH